MAKKIKILTEKTLWELEREINKLLEQGYEMQGTVTVFQENDYERDYYGAKLSDKRLEYTRYMQVMIKDGSDFYEKYGAFIINKDCGFIIV